MIRSMTGFAAKTISLPLADGSKASLSISIKSLNSRYFEATCKLPYQLTALETDLTKLMKKMLYRGHIYFTIYLSNPNIFKSAVEPSLSIIEDYIQAIERIKKQYPISGELSISDILQLPNVFSVQESEINDEAKKYITDTTNELILQLIAGQQKEGASLKQDIDERLKIMQQEMDTIARTSGTLMESQKEKIMNTIAQVKADETSLADIQKHAAYVLLEKMDINEEIVRFQTHLKSLTAQLASSSIEIGKRIDFTLQEMAREINTIAAKCSDATISSLAINIKVELEKAREQVQNIV